MKLDKTGWPQLPNAGTKIVFTDGLLWLKEMGVCTVIRAEHCRNAGKPGGNVWLETEYGEIAKVNLSQIRNYAEEVNDEEMEAGNE